MLSRRAFLRSSTLLALTPTVPAFLDLTARAARPERDGRVLVVIQLDGGNDGINTVVPYADEGYARYRRHLRLPRERLVRINDRVGFHPALRDMGRLLDSHRLAVVQGVSYPNPSRSHARSMAIWQTARFDAEEHRSYGWLGRALGAENRGMRASLSAFFIGTRAVPTAVQGRGSVPMVLTGFQDLRIPSVLSSRRAVAGPEVRDDLLAFTRRTLLEGYETADRLSQVSQASTREGVYPQSQLAEQLQLIARLLKAGAGARVFYTLQAGYDTHETQLPTHANILEDLASSLRAFLDDLAAARIADRVTVLCFSEFGRRVAENASAGTDHGTAGPVFLAGPAVRSGLVGESPSLLDLEDGDLRMRIDFRRVYATVLEDWLRLPARAALAGAFERLPLFR